MVFFENNEKLIIKILRAKVYPPFLLFTFSFLIFKLCLLHFLEHRNVLQRGWQLDGLSAIIVLAREIVLPALWMLWQID